MYWIVADSFVIWQRSWSWQFGNKREGATGEQQVLRRETGSCALKKAGFWVWIERRAIRVSRESEMSVVMAYFISK